MKRAFTIIETVIVIAIIALISAILIPQFVSGYDNTKQEIIDIYNGKQVQIIDIDTKEIIYQGDKENANLKGYTLIDVDNKDCIIMDVKENNDAYP